MTVAEIAEEFGCGLRTAYPIAEQGKPVPTPGGKGMRIARIDFENWIRKQRERRAWDRGQALDSLDEDVSGTAGSPSQAAGPGASERTAPIGRLPKPPRASSSDEPRTRPIKP